MAAKKTEKQTPSDFIRSMPSATPAEIMAAAKKAGIKFSRGLIYMVRSKSGGGGAKRPGRPAKAAKAAPKHAPAAAPKASGTVNEASFRRMVLDLGVSRSRVLIGEVERRIAEIVGR